MVLDGKQKVTITLAGIAFLGAAGIGSHAFLATHLKAHLFPVASAQEMHQQIKQAADAAKSAADAAQAAVRELRTHVVGEELTAARNKVDTIRTDLSTTRLWESANGENDISRARRLELERALERTMAYVRCLEEQRPNCQP